MQPIAILFEHDDFIIVSKPANSSFHSEDHQPGFFEQLKQQRQDDKLFPVHRLDKMTSGLLIVAKSLAAAQHFQQLFSQRAINKFYLAISSGKAKKKQGWIKGDMKRSRRSSWQLCKTCNNPAITLFKSLAVIPGKRLFIVKPLTGKTHQIRVALTSISCAIDGDPIYNKQNDSDRGYLHAYALQFNYAGNHFEFIECPTTGETFLRPEMQLFIQQQLSHPWSLDWPD